MTSVLANIMVCIGFEHVNNVCLLLIIPFRLVLFHRDRINKATQYRGLIFNNCTAGRGDCENARKWIKNLFNGSNSSVADEKCFIFTLELPVERDGYIASSKLHAHRFADKCEFERCLRVAALIRLDVRFLAAGNTKSVVHAISPFRAPPSQNLYLNSDRSLLRPWRRRPRFFTRRKFIFQRSS